MRVYIAGPMRGYPFYNFKAFDAAEAELRELGHDVINPANVSREIVMGVGLPPENEESYEKTPFHFSYFLLQDLEELSTADCLVLLSGWTNSRGAHVELEFARYLGIPTYASLGEFRRFSPVSDKPKAA